MTPTRGALRVLMLLWAIVQIAQPTVASVADAKASASGATAHAHVENKSHRTCVPVHDSDCALCQYLSGLASSPGSSASAVAFALAATQVSPEVVTPRAIELRGLPAPRGPPAV